MTKHITVGYDGSASSIEAVRWAADEASLRGAALRIVTCFDVPLSGPASIGYGFPEAVSVLQEDAQTRVEEMAASVRAAHVGTDVSTLAAMGPLDAVVIPNAEPDDLIVLGASGHSGAAAFWLGSTPRGVLHQATCTVVIVRGQATTGRPNRVVVGIDGSTASNDALEWAGDAADRSGAELVIVHGWSYPYLAYDGPSAQARDLTQIDAACALDKAVEHATARFGAPVTGCLVEASAVTALLQTAQDGDLLVVGSRGHGGIRNALFGSTVNLVLDQAAVPVAVVPPSDREAST